MGIELSVIWFVIIVFATLMYIVMDGFDLGIGLLSSTCLLYTSIAYANANPIHRPHIAIQARYILELDRVRHCLPPILSGRPLSRYSPESSGYRARISRLPQPAFSRSECG